MKYSAVCLGGTFDQIHKGHEALLNKAFEVGERVLIGVTSDEYVKKNKLREGLTSRRSLQERRKSLKKWFSDHEYTLRATIATLDDAFGPSVTDASLEAIVVSEETKRVAVRINEKRKERGLPALIVIVVPMVPAEDVRFVSSTRVRKGEIDTAGRLILPDNMRHELAKPLGVVVPNTKAAGSFLRNSKRLTISVGDRTTYALLTAGIVPALMIIDHRVNRKAYRTLQPIIKAHGFRQQTVRSGPGYISYEAIQMITAWFSSPQPPHVIVVFGEEDLLALPVLAYAPIGSVVYYGQPNNKGIVEVHVTAKNMHRARSMLGRFVSVYPS